MTDKQAPASAVPPRVWRVTHEDSKSPMWWVREPAPTEVAIGYAGVPYVPESALASAKAAARAEILEECAAAIRHDTSLTDEPKITYGASKYTYAMFMERAAEERKKAQQASAQGEKSEAAR